VINQALIYFVYNPYPTPALRRSARRFTARFLRGDFFGLNKYSVAKNIISNLMDNGSASKTTHGETKSAVAEGTIAITDEAAQKERTGLTPEDSIARLRRDTEGTQTAAAQIDLGKIERQAQDKRAMKKPRWMQASRDDIYESCFNKKAELYEIAISKKLTLQHFHHKL